MKKVISFICVAVLLFSLFSCNQVKNREYDEGEVLAAAKPLIEASIPLNEIFWGEGIGYIEDYNTSDGYYYEANFVDLKEIGISTIEDLKKMTREVFSEEYSNIIFSTTLSSVSDSSGIQGLARYYQKYKDVECTEPDVIMVYSLATVFLTDDLEYLYDTMDVVGSVGDVVNVKLSVRVTRDGATQIRELTVGLIEEENGWRINDSTYMVFNPEQ